MIEKSQRNTLTIDRLIFTDNSTIGDFCMDGEKFCFVLEDTCRAPGVKIAGETAIPPGLFEIRMEHSPHFGCDMPFLFNEALGVSREPYRKDKKVPFLFEDVMLHFGNLPTDTRGCPLVGMRHGVDVVYDSKTAFQKLLPEILKRLKEGKLYLRIFGGRPLEAKAA